MQMEIKILPIWSTLLLSIWRRVRKHRGHTGPVLPPNFELLNLPLSAEGVMVGEGGPCVGCGWSFFHVKRYTKGLRSTCLPSPCLLLPVVSESLYKTHTHTHKACTVLVSSESKGVLEASSFFTSWFTWVLPKQFTMQLIHVHFAELVNSSI